MPSTIWAQDIAAVAKRHGVDVISLAGGITDPLPPHVVEAGAAALASDRRPHSRGDARLREAISEKLSRDNGISVDPESGIIVTNGAMQAVACTLQAYIEPGDQVVMLGPGFFVHHLISFYGGEPRVVLCREEDGYHVDVDRLRAAVTERTKVLLLINPGNPTGVVYTMEELQQIAELAESHDLLVISDEAYERFVYEGNVHVSIASLPGMARRTLTIHSFTKCYGLRAGRIGFAAGDSQLIAPVAKAFEWATLTGNPASQAMAWAALVGPQDWIEKGMRELVDNRDLIRRRLEESDLISTVVPQGATFYYLNFSRLGVGEDEFCNHLLARYGVPTVPGASFAGGEMQEGGYLRLPFGAGIDTIERAIGGVQAAAEDAISGDPISTRGF
ncbi:MAG: pyridoxal phosphate-dependent aminotransferase [bacterium]|nr:pyridoxal phosphate-dependent aminotransferase [bacterium]